MPISREDEQESRKKTYSSEGMVDEDENYKLTGYFYGTYGPYLQTLLAKWKKNDRHFERGLPDEPDGYVTDFFIKKLLQGKTIDYIKKNILEGNAVESCLKKRLSAFFRKAFWRYVTKILNKYAEIKTGDVLKNTNMKKLPLDAKVTYEIDENGNKIKNEKTGNYVVKKIVRPKREIIDQPLPSPPAANTGSEEDKNQLYPDIPAPRGGEIVNDLMKKEEKQKFYEAIDNLPEKLKTAARLFYINNFTKKEIAELMNTTVGAVKQLIFRAKKFLIKKLRLYYKD